VRPERHESRCAGGLARVREAAGGLEQNGAGDILLDLICGDAGIEARSAEIIPWEPSRASLYRTIFPQMAQWLSEDEGTQLRFDFDTELARLEAA
jgi:hypothetical protein